MMLIHSGLGMGRHIGRAGALAWLAFATACGGGADDSCQVDADCNAPLVCSRSATSSDLGRCREATATPVPTAPTTDAGQAPLRDDPVVEDAGG